MDGENLGCRSLLVLMKLGHELRPCYQDMIEEELPPELGALAEKLMGYAEFREVPESADQG